MAYVPNHFINEDPSVPIDADNLNRHEDKTAELAGLVDILNAKFPLQTASLGYLQVTNSKIAPDAVTNDKLADNAITTEKIEDGAITKVKMAGGTLLEVGDVITSARTDLGTNFALTNGAYVPQATYPALWLKLKNSINREWSQFSPLSLTSVGVNPIIRCDYTGTYYLVAFNNGNNIVTLYYSTDMSTWQSVTLTFANLLISMHMYVLNNKIIIIGNNSNNRLAEIKSALKTSFSTTGNWTTSTLSNTSSLGYVMKYVNGYYVLCTNSIYTNPYYACIYYSTDATTWTRKQLVSSGGDSFAKDIIYDDGKYIVIGRNYTTDSIYIWYSTTINGTYTPVLINTATGSVVPTGLGKFDDGNYVTFLSDGTMLYSTVLNTTWKKSNSKIKSEEWDEFNYTIHNTKFLSGTAIMYGVMTIGSTAYPFIASISSIYEVAEKYMFPFSVGNIHDMNVLSGLGLAVGITYTSSTSTYTAVFFKTTDINAVDKFLPSIALDGTYTYIRVQ